MKLIQVSHFSCHFCDYILYCAAAAVSVHVFKITYFMCPDPRILCEPSREAEEQRSLDCQHLTFFPVLNEASPLPEDFSEQCMDTQLILKELEPTEEVRVTHLHLEPHSFSPKNTFSCEQL